MKKNRKFHGIKAAVGEMPRRNNYDGTYLEVHYDMDEDEVYTHLSLLIRSQQLDRVPRPRCCVRRILRRARHHEGAARRHRVRNRESRRAEAPVGIAARPAVHITPPRQYTAAGAFSK